MSVGAVLTEPTDNEELKKQLQTMLADVYTKFAAEQRFFNALGRLRSPDAYRERIVGRLQATLDQFVAAKTVERYKVVSDDSNNTKQDVANGDTVVTMVVYPTGSPSAIVLHAAQFADTSKLPIPEV